MAETKTKAKKKTPKHLLGSGSKNVVKKQKGSDGIVPHDAHSPEKQQDLIDRGQGLVKSLGLPSFDELMQMCSSGRPRYFENAQTMYERACAYFQWAVDNPWYRYEYKDHGMQAIEVGRPFTMEALCMYLRVSVEYFNMFEQGLKIKTSEEDKQFFGVIKFIRHTVRNQKFEGAAIGAFNANLISYDLGIRKDVSQNGGGGGSMNIIIENPDYEQLLEETKNLLQALDDDGDAQRTVLT